MLLSRHLHYALLISCIGSFGLVLILHCVCWTSPLKSGHPAHCHPSDCSLMGNWREEASHWFTVDKNGNQKMEPLQFFTWFLVLNWCLKVIKTWLLSAATLCLALCISGMCGKSNHIKKRYVLVCLLLLLILCIVSLFSFCNTCILLANYLFLKCVCGVFEKTECWEERKCWHSPWLWTGPAGSEKGHAYTSALQDRDRNKDGRKSRKGGSTLLLWHYKRNLSWVIINGI